MFVTLIIESPADPAVENPPSIPFTQSSSDCSITGSVFVFPLYIIADTEYTEDITPTSKVLAMLLFIETTPFDVITPAGSIVNAGPVFEH